MKIELVKNKVDQEADGKLHFFARLTSAIDTPSVCYLLVSLDLKLRLWVNGQWQIDVYLSFCFISGQNEANEAAQFVKNKFDHLPSAI